VVSHPDRITAVAGRDLFLADEGPEARYSDGGRASVLGANDFDTRPERARALGDVRERCGRTYCMDSSLGG